MATIYRRIDAEADGFNYWAIAGISEIYSGDYWGSSSALTPLESYAIDTKVDDGMPNTGQVQARGTTPTGPFSGGSPLYDLSADYANYAQPSTPGNCTMGGTNDSPTDPTDVYNVDGSSGDTQACALSLRWN